MFRNYFKTAWRNLLKNKFYSFITVAGLTIGLTVGILILFWVQDETSIDGFHTNAAHIYKLENQVGTGTSQQIWTATAAPIGKLGKQELPVITDMVRFSDNPYDSKFKVGNKVMFEENKILVDPSFFSVFDFPLVLGNKSNPFPDIHSLVLTQQTAERYFGSEDPIGKVILVDDTISFKVTGVVANFPKNSAFHFDFMFPIDLLNTRIFSNPADNLDNDFRTYNYSTFLLLKPNTNLAKLSTDLKKIHLRVKPDDTDVNYLFLPLTKAHLYRSDGTEAGMETVRMFTIIALIILAIACINYVNLSTARSMLRAKEVSLRKIVGAARYQLFLQFMVETALVFILATILALVLLAVTMPFFNQITGKDLVFDLLDNHLWQVIGITITATLLVSSIYPALLLSSFEPLKAIKGRISIRINDVFFRKALVVTQFAFSVILIIGTFIISRQLNYIRSKELGFDKEQIFSFYVSPKDNLEAIRNDLSTKPGIVNIAKSKQSNIVSLGNQTGDNDYDGKEKGSTFMMYPTSIDKDFIPFFKMKLVEGSNFTGSPSDSTHFILNETAVNEAGLKDPIGKRFRLWGVSGTIIGVVKDFHFASLKQKIQPAIFYHNPDNFGRLYVRTTGATAAKAIASAEQTWKKFNSEAPFVYAFLDENYNLLYKGEQRTGTLFNIFAGIAILISCLGLLGLAAYTAQIRTREIGVRKVLGASVPVIIGLLAKDFIRLVLIAIVIAVPIAWYAMNQWLMEFVYKVNVGWVVFVVAGLLAVVIALLTISFQSVRAALANPVKSLRSE